MDLNFLVALPFPFILVLDCCYSGAFARGLIPRADKTIHTKEYFDQGRGRIVLTASDAMQYSFEENALRVEVTNPGSIFTRAIVDGLKTAKADLNQDGHIASFLIRLIFLNLNPVSILQRILTYTSYLP
jgi:hypothetical protein